jgi:hypothetical protein
MGRLEAAIQRLERAIENGPQNEDYSVAIYHCYADESFSFGDMKLADLCEIVAAYRDTNPKKGLPR